MHAIFKYYLKEKKSNISLGKAKVANLQIFNHELKKKWWKEVPNLFEEALYKFNK